MDGQDCDFLHSSRDLSAFELAVQTARSKVEVEGVLQDHDLTEEAFTDGFPDLAKAVQDLPDESSPAG